MQPGGEMLGTETDVTERTVPWMGHVDMGECR